MVASSYPTTRDQAHSPLLLVLALIAGTLAGCQRIGSVAPAPDVVPEPAAEPMLEMERVEGHEELVYRAQVPAVHGYGRGDLLGIFAQASGELDVVGYGYVTRARGQSVELLASYLPDEHRAGVLWLGPLPDDEHLGHRIGKVLESPDTGRFYIDVGQGDGVRVGDRYQVYAGVINDTNFDARTLQKRPVGQLEVVKADHGKMVSLAKLREGSAPRGAWVELIDGEVHGARALDQRKATTVLVLHLVDDRLDRQEDPQRLYWKKLKDVLVAKTTSLGGESLLVVAFAERNFAMIDGTQSAIVEVGREHGADVVVWGSVQCTSSEACVRPHVTFVNQEKFGSQARSWETRVMPKSSLIGFGDDVGGVDASVVGLTSWLIGLAYFQAQEFADAAYHLERVPLDDDLHLEWMMAQGFRFRCYKVLGAWAKGEATARRSVDHGRSVGMRWFEARGRVDLAMSLYDRGLYDESLAQAKQAKALAQADGDLPTVAAAWGGIADILQARGELDEALRIRKEEQLPYYEEVHDAHSQAAIWNGIADISYRKWDFDEAIRIHENIRLPIYEGLGDLHSATITRGRVADILFAQGKLDEALLIRREQEVPVYERLGDARSLAVTWGKIGDILHVRGELDEELRIRKERELLVYEELGDAHAEALTWVEIATISRVRGNPDESLRIHREKVLPVFERMRDEHQVALSWRAIGNIMYDKGRLDEALRIRMEKELPAFEKLKDDYSAAVTWANISDISKARGDLDEALRILTARALPVFERLHASSQVARTWGKIADIRYRQGDLDESLRLRTEKELPAYEEAGDARAEAVTRAKISDILYSQGHLDDALRVRRDDVLPIFERLGDVRSAAVTWGRIGDIMFDRGDLDEALRIRKERELPVYERLGDVQEAALAWGKIADVLYKRGQLKEALRIHKRERLPVYESLSDVYSIALTWAKIAKIRGKQGHLDEAIDIYDIKVIPVLETMGAEHELIYMRSQLAHRLLARRRSGDRARAESLFRLALEGAETRKLASALEIRAAMTKEGFALHEPL